MSVREFGDGVIRGRDLMLFRQQGDSMEALGAATSHTFHIAAENSDISNKDTAQFHTVLPGGNLTWDISAECMYTLDDGRSLMDDIISGSVYKVAFGLIKNPSSTGVKPADGWQPNPLACYTGQAFLSDHTVNAPYEGQATYSAQFQGSGPIAPMSTSVAIAYADALEASAAVLKDEKAKKELLDHVESLRKRIEKYAKQETDLSSIFSSALKKALAAEAKGTEVTAAAVKSAEAKLPAVKDHPLQK